MQNGSSHGFAVKAEFQSPTSAASVVEVLRLQGPADVVLDGGVQEDGDDEEGDDDVEFDGDAAEGPEQEDGGRPEALQHAEVLEGDVVVIGTAQVDQVYNTRRRRCMSFSV